MGALGPVLVEQLTAKDSVEVVLDELNAGQRQMKSETSTDTKEKHAKLHYLLKSAKLIRRPPQKAKKRRVMGADATDDADMNVKQPAKKAGGVRFEQSTTEEGQDQSKPTERPSNYDDIMNTKQQAKKAGGVRFEQSATEVEEHQRKSPPEPKHLEAKSYSSRATKKQRVDAVEAVEKSPSTKCRHELIDDESNDSKEEDGGCIPMEDNSHKVAKITVKSEETVKDLIDLCSSSDEEDQINEGATSHWSPEKIDASEPQENAYSSPPSDKKDHTEQKVDAVRVKRENESDEDDVLLVKQKISYYHFKVVTSNEDDGYALRLPRRKDNLTLVDLRRGIEDDIDEEDLPFASYLFKLESGSKISRKQENKWDVLDMVERGEGEKHNPYHVYITEDREKQLK